MWPDDNTQAVLPRPGGDEGLRFVIHRAFNSARTGGAVVYASRPIRGQTIFVARGPDANYCPWRNGLAERVLRRWLYVAINRGWITGKPCGCA